MAYLKEDGRLDVEHYCNLSAEDFVKEYGKLTIEQKREYANKLPIKESQEEIPFVVFNGTLDEFRKKFKSVDAKEHMAMLNKKYFA